MLNIAILRKVRPGREAEFEALLERFFREASAAPGVRGAYLLRPDGRSSREYGIVRTFASKGEMRRFYASDLYLRWQDEIAPLVEGAVERRPLHGLEAFFRGPREPAVWKMAVLTWIGVTPAVYVSTWLAQPVVDAQPQLVQALVVNALVVAALTWVFMPILTRLFRRGLTSDA